MPEHSFRKTPPSRRVRVAGKLDSLRHSDRQFTLHMADGSRVIGVAKEIKDRRLSALWGQPVVISGLAVYHSSGALLWIGADHIAPATDADLEVWSHVPEPLGVDIDMQALQKPQGPHSGINAFFGLWPGDESDEEWNAMIEELD